MYNTSILDSNRIINLKNQHGLHIVTGNSVSTYSAQSKLKKAILANCEGLLHKIDLGDLIDKIVDRCDDVETIEFVSNYLNAVSAIEFVKQAQGKIRPFFKMVKNFIPTTEFTAESKYVA